MRFLAFLLAACSFARAVERQQPFEIRVVDEATDKPVPMAVLDTVHGLRFITDSAGVAAFDEPGLMRRRVFFTVSSPGYVFPTDNFGFVGLPLDTVPGGMAEIKLTRQNIAERAWRVTGQGIYRDTALLGHDAPLPYPNLSGGVLEQTGTQVAFFNGKLWWLWSDTRRAAHPLDNVRGTVATSDLPDKGGLDPAQGVHLTYAVNDRDEPQPALPGKEPGRIHYDGLVSVKDMMGAEHLLAHYEQLSDDGKRIEHGLVEWNTALKQFERAIVLSDDYLWQFPQGHAVPAPDEQRVYFGSPYALVRVPATYEAIVTPSLYEALTWDENKGEIRWQQSRPPMTHDAEDRWMAKKLLKWSATRLQTTDVATDKEVLLRSGSIRWSAWRKLWLLIAADEKGDVWYVESSKPDGPWHSAVRIATHGGKGFADARQIEWLDQEGGRVIHFLGTVLDESLTRYHGTQVMYRLNLDDARLRAAR